MLQISVSEKKRDWEGLRRKISRGVPLEEASVQLGIPLEEVFSHVSEKLSEIDTLNFELRLVGQGNLKKALTKLRKLASENVREGKDFESTDFMAAQALGKLAIEALKLSKSGKGARDAGGGQPDLFDVAEDPWALKKIE